MFNILLQILEDGKLTDAQGRKDRLPEHDHRDDDEHRRGADPQEFTGFHRREEDGLSYDEMKGRVMAEPKRVLRPELMNRIDELIVFRQLEKPRCCRIVDILMKRRRSQIAVNGASSS